MKEVVINTTPPPRKNLTRADSGILSEPSAFPRNGLYGWDSTGLNLRSSNGRYWSSLTNSTMYSHGQLFYSTGFYSRNGYYRGYGFAVRCIKKVGELNQSRLRYSLRTVCVFS